MTENARYSLAELHGRFTAPTDRIRLQLAFASTHEERLKAVHAAIDWIIQEHTKTRQTRFDRSEDALSIDIVTDLKAIGFEASHDTQYGGHCDIVVEARDGFLWIAEAKIHGAYDWLLKGFQQLDTRYSTGIPGQDSGGMIIYCRGQNVAAVMQQWEKHLAAARCDVQISIPADNPLNRESVHLHPNTGLPFKVRHTPVSLHFNPQD